jgi:hypothetical protein
MMKFKFLLICIFIFFTCPRQLHAQQVSELIEVKCYVELIGGEHTIHHAMISSSRFKGIKTTLIGKKILLTTGEDKRAVHKVIECTLANNTFNNVHAIALQNRLTY